MTINVNEPIKRLDRKGFSMSMELFDVFIGDKEFLNETTTAYGALLVFKYLCVIKT